MGGKKRERERAKERERERESKRTGYRVQDVRDLLGEQVCSDFGVSNSVGY